MSEGEGVGGREKGEGGTVGGRERERGREGEGKGGRERERKREEEEERETDRQTEKGRDIQIERKRELNHGTKTLLVTETEETITEPTSNNTSHQPTNRGLQGSVYTASPPLTHTENAWCSHR